MSIWHLKALVQKTISLLPFKHNINYFFQKNITKGIILRDDIFESKLVHANKHLLNYSKFGKSKEKLSTLEIGTGWYPVVPLAFFLRGIDRIVSIDISDLLTTDTLHTTIKKFIEYKESGKLNGLLEDIDMIRFNKMKELLNKDADPKKLLKNLNIEIIVDDARKTSFDTESFDMINSNNTFEHIYPHLLNDILIEFKRILKKDGIMSHHIDMSDHFAHLDRSITHYNFLKFSDAQWNLIDNSIQPQSRSRISDYRSMYNKLGFKILYEESIIENIDDLKKVKLDKKYSSQNEEDLAPISTVQVTKKQN